jgi:hypothetical protein
MKHRYFISVGKRMSRAKRKRGRKLVTNQSAPPKTVHEAVAQAGFDDDAGKLGDIATQTSAAKGGETHFEMMVRKWEDRQKLDRADWDKADRETRRRYIIEALQYRLKPKDQGRARKHA